MKKSIKKIILSVLCLSLLLLLSACADKATLTETVLTIDDSFAGERTMSFSVEESSALVLDKLTEIFSDNIPEALEMSEPQVEDGTALYTFALKFDSLEDYTEKVTGLLGRAPKINYVEPSGDLFTSGITLTEDFTSGDLFTWALDMAKHEGYDVRIVTRGTQTSVVMGDSVFKTDSKISVKSEFTPLERVNVITERYGEDQYKRTFEIVVSAENLEKLGKTRLVENLLAPLTADVDEDMLSATPDFVINEETGEYSYLIISQMLTGEQLGKLTQLVLEGSNTVYSEGSQDTSGAFCVSGTLSEELNFEPFVCNPNGTSDVYLKYSAKDSTRFENNESEIVYEKNGITECSMEVSCKTVYELSSIVVESGTTASGKAHVYITCSYADRLSSKAAAQLAADVLSSEYSELDVYISTVDGSYDTASSDETEYCLRIDAVGSTSEVTTALQDAFGDGNSMSVEKIDNFRLFTTYNVEHAVDIAPLCEAAFYEGTVDYSFSGSMIRAKNVSLKVGDAVHSNDILAGEKNNGGFNKSAIESKAFVFVFQYEQLNIYFLLTVFLCGALVLGVLGLVTRLVVRSARKHKKSKKTDTAYEAVKEVALALVPVEQRGELAELPAELQNRQTVVLEPKYDDGLDEDGDEPEGVWLFSTMMKLLAAIVGVLFFFSYFTVTKNNLIGGNPEGVSGFNLIFGRELFDAQFEGYIPAVLLIIAPVLIIALLSFREALPRMIAPIGVFGISVFQVFFLLGLPDVIDARMEAVKAAVAEYITNPVYQTGYNYSLVVYVLLAICAALLAAAELVGLVVTKARKDD